MQPNHHFWVASSKRMAITIIILKKIQKYLFFVNFYKYDA